jgi:cobalt-zinc-cadmium efflux system membrane fusion protein
MITLIQSFALRVCLTGRALVTKLAFWLIASLGATAWAGAGHDHGEAPAQSAGVASPRISSQSDVFELVAVLEKFQLVIYLDRFASNEPVTKATIEVEAGSSKGMALAQPDGTYVFKSPLFDKPGDIPMSFTVVDGKESDLLAGDLKIPDPHKDHADHDHPTSNMRWTWLAYAAAALAVVLMVVGLWRKKRRAAVRSFGALVLLVFVATGFEANAGAGHDHGDEAAPAASGNAPKRQSDGSVFLPKVSQRLLAIRTTLAVQANLAKTIELSGRVIADPNAGGKVQPTQAGRIEPSAQGLPSLGQSVRKGQVMAIVRSSASAIERANQTAVSFEVQGSIDLARKRLARLEQLEGSVPQKDIETARAELQNLLQRSKAIGGSAAALETLYAPVSGVIAATNVVAGQVVDAREVLFEIIDPTRLMVEANAFDAGVLPNIASASVAVGADSLALRYIGAGRALREGAIPLLFRTESKTALPLAVNQTIKVQVQTREMTKGFAIANASVVKNTSNQDVVWVHSAAENFVPRVVRYTSLDGARIIVLDGLQSGDRVVTQGATLVNQVR